MTRLSFGLPHGDMTLPALQAAKRGWLVYPLRPRSKRPYFARVTDLATIDPATIQLWFDALYDDADLGAIPPGHIVRVDVDRHRADSDGRQVVAGWRSEGLDLPDTLTVSTPREGHHLYYGTREALTSHALCPDGSVELKVGATILPPSRGYKWCGLGDEQIADLPAWVVEKWHDERRRRWYEHGRPPIVEDLADLIDRITIVTGREPVMRRGFGSFCCPAHDDRKASAWLRTSTPFIVGCFAGCPPAAILIALGMMEAP